MEASDDLGNFLWIMNIYLVSSADFLTPGGPKKRLHLGVKKSAKGCSQSEQKML